MNPYSTRRYSLKQRLWAGFRNKVILLGAAIVAWIATIAYGSLMFASKDIHESQLMALECFAIFFSVLYHVTIMQAKLLDLRAFETEVRVNLGTISVVFGLMFGMGIIYMRIYESLDQDRLTLGTSIGIVFGAVLAASAILRWIDMRKALSARTESNDHD